LIVRKDEKMTNGEYLRSNDNKQLAELLSRNLGKDSCDGCIVPERICRMLNCPKNADNNWFDVCTKRIEEYLNMQM
jgi:hypothetical protein